MSKYSAHQPKPGEVVLHCSHPEATGTKHFLSCKGMVFHRPDGSRGVATWLVVCDRCWVRAKMDPMRVAYTGDSVWQGDEPIVEETEESGKVYPDVDLTGRN